jgi:hypothetical protein
MANTFYNLGTITVGSGGASSIDFTSIPQTYTDLYITLSNRDSYAGHAETFLRFNNSASSEYDWRWIRGSGTAASSSLGSSATSIPVGIQPGSAQGANIFGNTSIYISNYTSSNYKSLSS